MQVEWYDLSLLCLAAFCAGFVDAIVGGGGLIQLPAALIILPSFPVQSVIGSLKIPAFCGTAMAIQQYLKKVAMNWKLLAVICTIAFFASYAGSEVLTLVSNSFMKPVLLVVLSAVAVYTFIKKDFGQQETKHLPADKELQRGILISLVIGFYDGFIGPGAGSFLIMAFVILLGYNFLSASAHAKMINLATNLGSVTLFIMKGSIIWKIALPMAAANSLGGFTGAKLAIAKGNKFIRIFFLVIVIGILLRFMWDVFGKK
jgi:uncharacterized membrane protein YfcA